MSSRISRYAVGYMVHASAGSNDPAWQILKANLSRERLMPLVGVLTPDLRWLAGFGGPPDEQKLMNALETARRLYPVSSAWRPTATETDTRTAQLNEYGEYEWTPLESLFPDAPHAEIATTDAAPPAGSGGRMTPVVAPRDAGVATTDHDASAPAEAADVDAAPEPTATVVAMAAPEEPDVASDAEPTAATAPASYAGESPAQALRRAADQIRSGDLDGAKATLADVLTRATDDDTRREAQKGGVAVYNAERIRDARGDRERDRILEEARQNLRGSLWGALFS